VNPGASVHQRRIFACENADSHSANPGPMNDV
jgi:hypothetical protein